MLRIALGLSAALVAAVPALAQLPGANDADAKELAAYQLTVPVLDKVLQATKNLVVAAKNDPRFKKQAALKAELKTLEEKEEPTEADTTRMEQLSAELEKMERSIFPKGNNQTLSEMAAAMQKEPVFAQALAAAGLTAREYAKFIFAYMSAGMVAGMMEQGVVKEVPKELASSVNLENIKFFKAHKAELQAFQEAMKSLEQP
jgi:hypothetical protein